jgi:hypothetical protein
MEPIQKKHQKYAAVPIPPYALSSFINILLPIKGVEEPELASEEAKLEDKAPEEQPVGGLLSPHPYPLLTRKNTAIRRDPRRGPRRISRR